jgi:hypothetical protein
MTKIAPAHTGAIFLLFLSTRIAYTMGLMANPAGHLAEFRYQTSKDGKVFLYWNNRLVKTLSGNAARQFIARASQSDQAAIQMLMAKATGNFKRGNERPSPHE